MASRQYNKKTFTAEVKGYGTLYFHCWTTDQWDGFCHSCWCNDLEQLSSRSATTRCKYYNRTWEAFHYQSVLTQAIRKFPKAMQKELHEQLVVTPEERERKKAEEELERFKQLHAGLTDKQKELLAQTPPMQTEEDVHRMMGIMGVMNVFNQLGADK